MPNENAIPPEVKAAVIKLLGKKSDGAIGKKYNISRERVRQMRTARNIPVYKHEFGRDSRVVVSTAITEADERDTKKAMKKIGERNRSRYIRTAVRDKNREVLEK
jgi:hypothetical protein